MIDTVLSRVHSPLMKTNTETTATEIETLKASMDRAIAKRAVEASTNHTPRDWDGQSPVSHYGIDGHMLPEIRAYRAALRAAK